MDARTRAVELEDAARLLGGLAAELSRAGLDLGRAATQCLWHGQAADAALGSLALTIALLEECALLADEAARSASRAAVEAWEIVAVLQKVP